MSTVVDLASSTYTAQAEEEPHVSATKILEFCQLCEKRTLLNPSQIIVFNELELYASNVTELDISEVPFMTSIVEQYIQHSLQHLHNLRKLVMDRIGLKEVPGSIGALTKLETLSLAYNDLKNLPVTLTYCQNLRWLTTTANQFEYCIQGMVLSLENLGYFSHDRKAKPATESGYTHSMTTVECGKRPYKLQTICAGAVFSAQIDYWNHALVGSRQCRVLNEQANRLDLCHNCKTAILLPSKYSVETYLVKFLDTKGIVRINVCSEACQDIVHTRFTQKNAQYLKEITRERVKLANSVGRRSHPRKNRFNYLEEVTKDPHSDRFSVSPHAQGPSPIPHEESQAETDTVNGLSLPPRGIHRSTGTGHAPTTPTHTEIERRGNMSSTAGVEDHQQHCEQGPDSVAKRDYSHVQWPQEARDKQGFGWFTLQGIIVDEEISI